MAGRRVCVIGAGISGLVSAKVLAEDGFDVAVFEKESALGGVWAASRTYPGLRTNNPRDTYAFSDHPFPRATADFPSAADMRAYLASYAERFGLLRRIRFATEVVRASWAGGVWKVDLNSDETREFDFLVVCNGVFSEPHVPPIEGLHHFVGRAVHSSGITDPALARGKRVIVVGGSKSALDCAAWAAREAGSCTLVLRQAYWMWPRYLLGLINIQWMMFSRQAASLLGYYRLRGGEAWLEPLRRRLATLVWRGLTVLLRRQSGVSGALVPDTPLPRHIESLGVGTEVYPLVRNGRIVPKRATIRRIRNGTEVELDSGEVLPADLVIFATGFRQRVPFLDDAIRRCVEGENGFHLYRLILPPEVPHLGFIGYNSSTACQLTSEVGAHWLSQHFLGALRLPSVEEMHRDVELFRRWAAEAMPGRARGFFLGPFVVRYLDDLLRDLGLSTTRTTNFLAENLLPTWPSRYRTLGEERRRIREGRAPGGFYLSCAHATGAALIGALAWMLWGPS